MRRAETGGVLRGDVGRTDGRVWEYGQSHAGGQGRFQVSNGGGDGGMIGARGVECVGEGEMAGGGHGGREVDGKEDREMERHEVRW